MVNDHNDEGAASLDVSIEATHNQDRGHLITSMTQGKDVYGRFHIICYNTLPACRMPYIPFMPNV